MFDVRDSDFVTDIAFSPARFQRLRTFALSFGDHFAKAVHVLPAAPGAREGRLARRDLAGIASGFDGTHQPRST